MNYTIKIRNFGKIKRADISIGDLTVFVGENNTGKSLIMQMIYIVLSEIKRMSMLSGNTFSVPLCGIKKKDSQYVFTSEWLKGWEESFNNYLEDNKADIIEHYYKKPISLESLRIDMTYEEGEEYSFEKNGDGYFSLFRDGTGIERVEMSHYTYGSKQSDENVSLKTLGDSLIIELFNLERYSFKDCIYLPASRTGLQLLYRYFISEKDRMITDNPSWIKNKQHVDALGLTLPVYDFLQFLLRYEKTSLIEEKNGEILSFINKNLIDGSLDYSWEEDSYIPRGSKKRIPLYLSSSMVNEVAPLVKILNGNSKYKYILYDEIEECLHPLKQGQMARTIARMVNSGWKMVVSTHSDTMASKINNLIMLSNKETDIRSKILKKLKYEEQDIFINQNIKVYEFLFEKNESVVEEVYFDKHSTAGYGFELFSKNIDQLYKETEMIFFDE